jgi:hypothetical protein
VNNVRAAHPAARTFLIDCVLHVAVRRSPGSISSHWVRGPIWDGFWMLSALWLAHGYSDPESSPLDLFYFALTALFWIGHRLCSTDLRASASCCIANSDRFMDFEWDGRLHGPVPFVIYGSRSRLRAGARARFPWQTALLGWKMIS